MGRHTTHDEGYYEDETDWEDDLIDLSEEQEGLRHRMIAVMGTSYGVSIAAHVALLLVLAAIVIAAPVVREEVRITAQMADPIKPYDPEAKKDLKETPDIPIPETDVQMVDLVEEPPTVEPPKGKETAAANKLNDFSVSDAYGPGPGAAGAKGSPLGTGRAAGIGGSPKSENAVNAALRWLKLHQSPNGSWDCDGWQQNCKQATCKGPGSDTGGASFDVGVTALAMLAYLGHGNTHRYGTYKRTVHRAQRWMRALQAGDGAFGWVPGGGHGIGAYNHALATNAMCELYAMTRDPFLKRPCQRAVDWILKAQNPKLGWKYVPRSAKNDVSVTGWMLLALKAAWAAGLEVPKESFAGGINYIKRCTSSNGITGYDSPGGGSSVLNGREDAFEALPVMTSVGALCRLFMGDSKTDVRRSIVHVSKSQPRWAPKTTNYYYWYYGTYAMFQFAGPKWKTWNKAMLSAILPHQRSGACEDGSWDGVGEWCAAGGRVYATAINVLTLEIYYRFDRGSTHFASAKGAKPK